MGTLDEKVALITGADSGLGFETAKKAASSKEHEYSVILACRNADKAERARQDIVSETGNRNVMVQMLDTSSLASVRKCVSALQKRGIHLDALVCNAGISPMHSGTTEEGFELVFATNYLGHFLLTMELLPSMNPGARILCVTSDMHNPPMGIQWKGADYLAYHAQGDRQRYSFSKLCAILFTYRLAAELQKRSSSITVNCFNPGFMSATNFSGGHGRGAHAAMVKAMMPDRYGTLEGSSSALASLVTEGRYAAVSGQYFDRTYGIGKSSDLSHDEEVQEELWTKSQEYTGIKADDLLNEVIDGVTDK